VKRKRVMKEKNIWKTIRLNSNIVKWDRVESKTSPGIPDLHGFFKDSDTGFGHTFWVELKLTKTNKVLLSSKQIAWHHRYEKYGGTSFICVKALLRRALLIYVGKRATELGEKGLKLAPDLVMTETWSEDRFAQLVKIRQKYAKPYAPI